MTPVTTIPVQGINVLSETDHICREVEPVIAYCIKQLPKYYQKRYAEELYNTAIVAVLENSDKFNSESGNIRFFYGCITNALNRFMANEVFGFSSYQKYKDYNAICKAVPDFEQTELTDDIVQTISSSTGLKREAIESALNDSLISNAIHYDASNDEYLASVDPGLDVYMIETELASVIDTALNCLHGQDLRFVCDLCGFKGRSVHSPRELQKKYGLTPTQYSAYLEDLRLKLLSSRTLRRYMGRIPLDQEYRIG